MTDSQSEVTRTPHPHFFRWQLVGGTFLATLLLVSLSHFISYLSLPYTDNGCNPSEYRRRYSGQVIDYFGMYIEKTPLSYCATAYKLKQFSSPGIKFEMISWGVLLDSVLLAPVFLLLFFSLRNLGQQKIDRTRTWNFWRGVPFVFFLRIFCLL